MKVLSVKGGDGLMKIKGVTGFILLTFLLANFTWAQSTPGPLTLDESIRIALERSLAVHSAKEGVMGAEFNRKTARAYFFPQWQGQYGYTWFSSPVQVGTQSATSIVTPPKPVADPSASATPITITIPSTTRYTFSLYTTLTQTLYAGGAYMANYRSSKLGLEISKANVEIAKQNVVLNVRQNYFNILRAERFVEVAKQAVKQFEGQLEVSRAFFEVGLIPKNDVLQAEVRMANALQAQASAENSVGVAKASFNNLLRREINEPVVLADVLEYKPFPLTLEQCVGEALQQRSEIKVAELSVGQAKESVKIVRSGMLPTVNVAGNYFRNSDQFFLNGDLKSDRWSISAVASMTLWDWGKVYNQVGASKVKVTQAEDSKTQILEGVILEVKEDYLNMGVAEKNVNTAAKSIEQAEENLRLNEERYKYQVATAFDVLDAVTLLAQTRVNYYGALSDYNVARAGLERSMGRM
jgi:outer membrane protein